MATELTPQQSIFAEAYFDPKSPTFSNALQSALKAGYSQESAENITSYMPKWFSELLGKRKRMLLKAEARLEKAIDSENETEANKVSMFIAKTIGKDEGYTERQEVTGKDGKDLIPDAEAKQKAMSVLTDYLNDDTGTP